MWTQISMGNLLKLFSTLGAMRGIIVNLPASRAHGLGVSTIVGEDGDGGENILAKLANLQTLHVLVV